MVGSQYFAVMGFKSLIGLYCFQIFGSHDQVIQFVNAGNVVYQVVGLYNDKGNSGDSDAYIPFTTFPALTNCPIGSV